MTVGTSTTVFSTVKILGLCDRDCGRPLNDCLGRLLLVRQQVSQSVSKVSKSVSKSVSQSTSSITPVGEVSSMFVTGREVLVLVLVVLVLVLLVVVL